MLAATFTAVYVLVVVGVGAVTGHPGGNPLTFVAAALAAVLLQPVRIRAGQLADRLVYGRRATPYEVLSEFSGQIAGTYSTEDVLPRMARMLVEATGGEAGRGMAADGEQRAPGGGVAIGQRVGARDRHGGHRGSGRPGRATAAPASGADAAATQAGNRRAAGTMGSRGPSWWSIRANGSARCGSPARRGSR